MKRNRDHGVVRTVGLAFTLAALASSAAWAQTVLKVLHQGDPGWVATYEEVAKRFEAANPDVDVQLVFAPHDAYNERVSAAVSSGDMPDIMELDAPFLANYVWSGLLRPLDGLVDPKLVADLTTSGVSQGTYPIDGKLYAIGIFDSTVALYANKSYLDKIGARIPTSVADAWTRAEFEEILEKLSKLEGVKWPIDLFRSYGIKSEWVTYGYEPLLVSAGCDVIDRKTWLSSGMLDGEACVDALTLMQSWVNKGWVVPASSGTNQFFAEGKPAALAWGGNWIYAQAKPTLGDDLIVLPLPNFGNGTKSPNGTWIWSVTQASKNPELAGKFLDFFMNDEGYRKFGSENGAFPGAKSFAAQSPLYAAGGPMALAYAQADGAAFPRPQHPAYPTITNAFMDAVDAIFNGADVAKTLSKAAETIDADIEDNGGYPPFGRQ